MSVSLVSKVQFSALIFRLAAFVAATSFILIPASVHAQIDDEERKAWRHEGVHYGAGLGLGHGPFATDSGPWLDGFGVADGALVGPLYFRLEPGLTGGWTSDAGRMNTGGGSAQNDETFNVFGFMARAMLGLDIAEWLTVRAGPVAGYLVGQYDSTVCPSESYGRGQYGLTTQLGFRLGESRRFEVAVQGEILADFANPRCRPQPNPSIPFPQNLDAPFLLTTEPSQGTLGFLSARFAYVWF